MSKETLRTIRFQRPDLKIIKPKVLSTWKEKSWGWNGDKSLSSTAPKRLLPDAPGCGHPARGSQSPLWGHSKGAGPPGPPKDHRPPRGMWVSLCHGSHIHPPAAMGAGPSQWLTQHVFGLARHPVLAETLTFPKPYRISRCFSPGTSAMT